MVGRKKAASTAKASSSKQQTITDLFKKNVPVPVAQDVPPVVVQPLPPTFVEVETDSGQIPITTVSTRSSPAPEPVASTSKTTEIIDITESPPPLKPPSTRKDSKKPLSSRSTKPSSGPSRPPELDVIDLTSHSDSPPTVPAYSIFAPRPKVDGPSRSTPSISQTPRPTYSIFNVKPKKPSGLVSPTKPRAVNKESDAPFPTKDEQHIRGPQTVFSTPAYPKRSSETRTQEPMEHFRVPIRIDDTSIPRTLTYRPVSTISEKEECIASIPDDHKRDHPAIARLSVQATSPPDASSSAEKLWSERWCPQQADGILGNEQHALYLRDWLRALEVRFEAPASLDSGENRREEARGVKRPKVMRSVARAKKRRQQSSDGWIVSDASDYSSDMEMVVEAEGGDDDDFSPTPVPGRISNSFRDHLANTILLAGPPGSGKTAAVYSCAEELGWEVFEVYPGIGKRNGASLESMIGEVGKNHLVRRTHVRGRGGDEETEPGADFGFVAPNLKAGTRQSVVLLEEVDILFKEDANFWPAVIRLIRESKRAVICTCNDLSLVPTSELPLQKILEFEPCVPDVAGSYLQGLCCIEGYIVKREVLGKMYAQSYDLRRTILRLQLLCQGFPLGTLPEMDHLLDWNAASRRSVPHADLISFMDAYMTRDSLDRPEVRFRALTACSR
ncbi:hypothetical protein B0H16DRAFT_1497573 [Mycena metata]|uniref:ATPase AAA-type core domain-containing protein n=1 Tax=Mycena metata TaxID=1033252 RepID=A0AAD7K9R4_9AGAR|nr:hypothetical protein B0H16DRAFT_1497573 [Mycena metata]